MTAIDSIPCAELQGDAMRMVMISEAPPQDLAQGFYALGVPRHLQTTLPAFARAGTPVSSMLDLLHLGVYITPASRCGKMGYAVSAAAIKSTCWQILERRPSTSQSVRAVLLMGDEAIKAFDYTTRGRTGRRAIPSGPT